MKGKKRYRPPQRTKTTYAEELKQKRQLGYEIISTWTAQLCLDTIAMVLNDPAVMGKDTLGATRLRRVCEAFNKLWPVNLQALQKCDEADYRRVKIDQAQAGIFGPDYLHWHERYPHWDERDKY